MEVKKKKKSSFNIVRATPGNILEVYEMYKRVWREKSVNPVPAEDQQKVYYWKLLEELGNPGHVVLLIKRGTRYLGFVHGVVAPADPGHAPRMFVKIIHVLDSKRKHGGGKMPADELAFLAGLLGVKKFDFMCDDDLVEYWAKKRNAKKVANYMTFEV